MYGELFAQDIQVNYNTCVKYAEAECITSLYCNEEDVIQRLQHYGQLRIVLLIASH